MKCPSNIQAFFTYSNDKFRITKSQKISIEILKDCYNRNKTICQKDGCVFWATNMAYLLK